MYLVLQFDIMYVILHFDVSDAWGCPEMPHHGSYPTYHQVRIMPYNKSIYILQICFVHVYIHY